MSDTNHTILLRIFKCKESEEYAKRVMAHEDVTFSIQCLIKLREMNAIEGSDEIIIESLWNAAVIKTFSVFDGKSSISTEILKSLPEGANEAYKYFRNYRSKHISHKVNPIDQIKPGIFLSNPDVEQKKVLGVGNLAMKDASYSDVEFVNSLGQFLDALKKQLEQEINDWSQKILLVAKGKDIEELYKLPPLRVVVPQSNHLHKGT